MPVIWYVRVYDNLCGGFLAFPLDYMRYNSRLPVVVYVPEGVEVRYRLWTAGAETKALEKG